MVRTPRIDKNGVRKGTWTPEEDWRLIAYVTRYGHWNWRQLPKFAGLARSGKSCRLRWLNYLRPSIKLGKYTQEEDETIIKLVQHIGYRWSVIASQLPGRTDNEIKNRWHTTLKKRFRENSCTHGKVEVSNSMNPTLVEPMPKNNINDPFQILPSPSQSRDSCSSSSTPLSHSSESFKTNNCTASDGNTNLVSEDEFAFLNASEEALREFFLLDDSPVNSIPNNTIDPVQFLLSTSQSNDDSCIVTSIPSSKSETSITADHTPVASYKNLVPEDEFGFLDALQVPMIDPTNCCPTSTPSFSSESFKRTNYNHPTTVSDKNLIPEDELACLKSLLYGEPMSGSFLLDHSLVDPMPKNITGPFQSSRTLFISSLDEIVAAEDEFAPQETPEENVSGSFCLEPLVGDIADVAGELVW